MKNHRSKLYLSFIVVLMIFVFNTTTWAAANKNVGYCNFTVNRTKVNKKAVKVKKGNVKLKVKRGFIRFIAPSRGKYTFMWTGPKNGQRADITPMYTLNKNTLSCLEDFYPYGKDMSNILFFVGMGDYTKYSQLAPDRYGGCKYSIVLDKGEEIYFYVKLTRNREAEVGLKITRKTAPKDKIPPHAITISKFEKLKQIITKKDPHNDGDPVLTYTKAYDYPKHLKYISTIKYKKQQDQIIFEYELLEGNKKLLHMSMTYDRSVIANGVIDVHATEYAGNSVKYDALAKVHIYTAKYTNDIYFNLKRNNTNLSVNKINWDLTTFFEFFLIDIDLYILQSNGMTINDLGFIFQDYVQ